MLCHRGVAAWLHAWHATTPATAPAAPRANTAAPVGAEPVVAEELVGILSCMAIAAIGR
ncbi:MAG: hypothetical protein ACRDQ6_22800 [Pseudonocardiaceae bacterium]